MSTTSTETSCGSARKEDPTSWCFYAGLFAPLPPGSPCRSFSCTAAFLDARANSRSPLSGKQGRPGDSGGSSRNFPATHVSPRNKNANLTWTKQRTPCLILIFSTDLIQIAGKRLFDSRLSSCSVYVGPTVCFCLCVRLWECLIGAWRAWRAWRAWCAVCVVGVSVQWVSVFMAKEEKSDTDQKGGTHARFSLSRRSLTHLMRTENEKGWFCHSHHKVRRSLAQKRNPPRKHPPARLFFCPWLALVGPCSGPQSLHSNTWDTAMFLLRDLLLFTFNFPLPLLAGSPPSSSTSLLVFTLPFSLPFFDVGPHLTASLLAQPVTRIP